ncbi:MAG: hypothetical protein NT003_04260, partial [Candidatus Magasanikbacteria bacterium]|nr:hypothetical protein [Candidatus Magasanikbacteria bacterium]
RAEEGRNTTVEDVDGQKSNHEAAQSTKKVGLAERVKAVLNERLHATKKQSEIAVQAGEFMGTLHEMMVAREREKMNQSITTVRNMGHQIDAGEEAAWHSVAVEQLGSGKFMAAAKKAGEQASEEEKILQHLSSSIEGLSEGDHVELAGALQTGGIESLQKFKAKLDKRTVALKDASVEIVAQSPESLKAEGEALAQTREEIIKGFQDFNRSLRENKIHDKRIFSEVAVNKAQDKVKPQIDALHVELEKAIGEINQEFRIKFPALRTQNEEYVREQAIAQGKRDRLKNDYYKKAGELVANTVAADPEAAATVDTYQEVYQGFKDKKQELDGAIIKYHAVLHQHAIKTGDARLVGPDELANLSRKAYYRVGLEEESQKIKSDESRIWTQGTPWKQHVVDSQIISNFAFENLGF